jgi:hypothetical protein
MLASSFRVAGHMCPSGRLTLSISGGARRRPLLVHDGGLEPSLDFRQVL